MKTISNLKSIFAEIWGNRLRLVRLSFYDLKSMNSGTFLGYFWNFLQPTLNIFVYWFVFAIGMRKGNDIDAVPYVIFMITGLIPWFFISASITQGANSITSYATIVKRMKFPLSIVPIKPILTNYFIHVCSMTIVLLVYVFSGVGLKFTVFQLIYYDICMIAFLMALAFMFSTLSVVSKDFQRTLGPIIRLLMYLSPIFYKYDSLSKNPIYAEILRRLNPIAYMVEGYRFSLVTGEPFWVHWDRALIFWGMVLIMFVIGINLHANLRKKFVDLI